MRPKTSGIWKHIVDLNKDRKASFNKTISKEYKQIFIYKPYRASGRKPNIIYKYNRDTGAFYIYLRKEYRIYILTITEAAIERHAAKIELARGEGL